MILVVSYHGPHGALGEDQAHYSDARCDSMRLMHLFALAQGESWVVVVLAAPDPIHPMPHALIIHSIQSSALRQ